jgi:hypothetical protein
MTDGQVGMSNGEPLGEGRRWPGFPVKMGSSSAIEMAIEAGAWGRTGTGWPRAMTWAAR